MRPEPTGSYRLQLRPGFGFAAAAALVPYLEALGVSHLYASPCLQAAAGSPHGYDVVDPSRVNAELGTEKEFYRLCRLLKQAGLGLLLDVVPNHMAIIGDQNPWWWDVLENGPASRYAPYFDVDWESSEARWPNKVLLPLLGDHYGRVLESEQLQLTHQSGIFTLHYHDQVFPIDPSTLAELLAAAAEACNSPRLGFVADAIARLPRPTSSSRKALERRHRDLGVLRELLVQLCQEKGVRAAIDRQVVAINADVDRLDGLIENQNYRLALWRAAGRDLGYRRFFDINDLAGLRVEDEEVFQATHALPLSWLRQGLIQGLRIDHPDGLRDPSEYFHRLHKACPQAWLVAEKILEPGEQLPSEWPIAGTTGYDFLNMAGGLFVDAAGERRLTRLYAEFTGATTDYARLAKNCKRLVLDDLLGSELNRLTALFVSICEGHRRHRDYTRHELHEALLETAACFPVYRTYLRACQSTVGDADARAIKTAIKEARVGRPELDPELLRFFGEVLLLRHPGELETELAMRFQQLTGPAMAKGVEDTALYRFHRLLCLNEVGGNPAAFGTSVDSFHLFCRQIEARHPRSLLASSTHDTKRSEDVRCRLALLSEIPRFWQEQVRAWQAANQHRKPEALDPNDEYFIYQTLVGAWPIDGKRLCGYLTKALREAKVHTSWTRPVAAYEDAVSAFALDLLSDQAFRRELGSFVARLEPFGQLNSLALTLLKMTSPGVPDIYQGTELWDLSLVDPDNRRPVDFDRRRGLLEELSRLSAEQILERTDEGLPKLWVLRQALRLRRRQPALFGPQSEYRPLYARGERAAHLVGQLRSDAVVALAPRLVMGLGGDWRDTSLDLPTGRWCNLMTNEEVAGGSNSLARLLARFPVALLERETLS